MLVKAGRATRQRLGDEEAGEAEVREGNHASGTKEDQFVATLHGLFQRRTAKTPKSRNASPSRHDVRGRRLKQGVLIARQGDRLSFATSRFPLRRALRLLLRQGAPAGAQTLTRTGRRRSILRRELTTVHAALVC